MSSLRPTAYPRSITTLGQVCSVNKALTEGSFDIAVSSEYCIGLNKMTAISDTADLLMFSCMLARYVQLLDQQASSMVYHNATSAYYLTEGENPS